MVVDVILPAMLRSKDGVSLTIIIHVVGSELITYWFWLGKRASKPSKAPLINSVLWLRSQQLSEREAG